MEGKDLYELFVDTGAFIALIDESDPLHQASQTFYSSLKKRTTAHQFIGRFRNIHMVALSYRP